MRSYWLSFLFLVSACAGMLRKPVSLAHAAATASTPAPVLDRSLFARDPQGQLTEERLQRILAAPIEVDLPARVGVLPVLPPGNWRGPAPDYLRVPAGVQPLTQELRGSEHFTLVTEMIPIPSGALGMEALRELAARYKLRYLLLYREAVTQRVRANPWALAYLTFIGAFFSPGRTLQTSGFVEASLLDVKTGLLAFTVRKAIRGRHRTNLWNRGEKLEALQARLVREAAPKLARDVRAAVVRFLDSARVENARRRGTTQPASG